MNRKEHQHWWDAYHAALTGGAGTIGNGHISPVTLEASAAALADLALARYRKQMDSAKD